MLEINKIGNLKEINKAIKKKNDNNFVEKKYNRNYWNETGKEENIEKFNNKNQSKLRKNQIHKLKIKYINLYLIFNNIIFILKFILIFIPITLSKKIFRDLVSINQIKLTINTKGNIQVLGSNFNTLPSSVTVNSYTYTLENKKINLTSSQNTVILKWNSDLTNCSNMFSSLTYIDQIDLSSFSISSVLNMYNMFSGCQKLTKINFGAKSTSSIKNMGYMFYNC